MAPSRISPDPPTSTPTAALPTEKAASLSAEQLDFWDTNGYLIIENALDPATTAALLAETKQMLNDFSLDEHPMTRFSTGEGEAAEHVGDDYFLSSGDKVRFFFEEDAFDPSTGALTKPKHRAINKIGHNLHGLHPSFRATTLSAQNAAVARSLRMRDPRVLQSMVICKQPEIGGRVPPHQDSTFLYTDPPSAVGFWYALEDATEANGCLSFAGGSHRRTPVGKRFVRMGGQKQGTGFEDVTTGRFPTGLEVEVGLEDRKTKEEQEEQQEEVYTLRETKAGTLVLIHGNLLHKSERNLSGKSRFIYTFHMIEGAHMYDERNWLQPVDRERGFERLYDVEG